jgi:hypothetical protein
MREIRFKLKKARKNAVGGASIEPMVKEATYTCCRWKKSYWLITLNCGKGACDHTSYLKKIPGRKRRKRYLNIHRYIKCINHEVMHGILNEIEGEKADRAWDNITHNYDGWHYNGRRYGWKNIMGRYFPDVYCEHE